MSREEIILDFIKNTIISLKDVLKPDEIKILCDAYVEIKKCEPTYKDFLRDIVSENDDAENYDTENYGKIIERLADEKQEYENEIVDALEYIARIDGESPTSENVFDIERILKGENNHIPRID